MEASIFCDDNGYTFEKELKAKGCINIIQDLLLNKKADASEIINDIINLIFNYYMCLFSNDSKTEVTLEEKIRCLYINEVIDEETTRRLLYLCEVTNRSYKLDENTNL